MISKQAHIKKMLLLLHSGYIPRKATIFHIVAVINIIIQFIDDFTYDIGWRVAPGFFWRRTRRRNASIYRSPRWSSQKQNISRRVYDASRLMI